MPASSGQSTSPTVVCDEGEVVEVKLQRLDCEKNQDLLEMIVFLFTKGPGALVWDPAAGTFSTANACMATKRKFVGSEKNLPLVKAATNRTLCAIIRQMVWSSDMRQPYTDKEANAALTAYMKGFERSSPLPTTDHMRECEVINACVRRKLDIRKDNFPSGASAP
jgi:hypothetical protein